MVARELIVTDAIDERLVLALLEVIAVDMSLRFTLPIRLLVNCSLDGVDQEEHLALHPAHGVIASLRYGEGYSSRGNAFQVDDYCGGLFIFGGLLLPGILLV